MKFMMIRALRTTTKKKLSFIPYLFTFANALFGFLAIITALEGRYSSACACILAAGLMDFLDGRLARALGATSSLGMELDSLCDAVSFCLAPTIVLYSWHVSEYGVLGIISLMFYVCAGLYRLAKFNITSTTQHRSFIGLPTPVAALLLVSMVMHGYYSWHLMMLVCMLALLMVSSIRFSSFKRQTRHTFTKALMVAGIILFSIIGLKVGYPVISLIIIGYILAGIGASVYTKAMQFLRMV